MPIVSFADMSEPEPSFSLVQPNAYHQRLQVFHGVKKTAICYHEASTTSYDFQLEVKQETSMPSRKVCYLGKDR